MMTIPKKIHQVWAGPDPFPHIFQKSVETWKKNHPEWEYKRWGEEELASFGMINQDLYGQAKDFAPRDWLRWRADIARLEVLYREGGVYCDTDSDSLKPLDELLEGVECFFIQSPNDLKGATQAVMGCAPGHPFIKHLLDGLRDNAEDFNVGAKLVQTVGGAYITRELRKLKPDDVAVFAADLFSGRSIRERDKGIKPNLSRAYVDHRYNNTDRMRNAGASQAAAWKAVSDVLSELPDVQVWLTCGTLLGHVREGRCMGHDVDVDLGIWAHDREKVSELLRSKRIEINRDRPHMIKARINGQKVDFYCHTREKQQVRFEVHYKGRRMVLRYPAHLFDNMRESVFYLKPVLIPHPVEDFLRIHYGPKWTEPDRNWKWYSSPLNMKQEGRVG